MAGNMECPEENRPPDERKIISDATSTLKETRFQLNRVQNILSDEVKRIDKVLAK